MSHGWLNDVTNNDVNNNDMDCNVIQHGIQVTERQGLGVVA